MHKLAIMVGKSRPQNQTDIFTPHLTEFINMGHELVLLSQQLDWQHIEKELSTYYSHTGQPSMPIRFMVGCLLLKRMYNLGDETLAKAWMRDPYMQYFTGEAKFQHKFPCDPSDFVHFRKRIGARGVEQIFALTVKSHGKDAFSKMVLSDTTVQENNVTFPTDSKLAKKVIDRCNAIAKTEGISQRQTYVRKAKKLLRDTYNSGHPKRAKKARSAQKKLKTISGRLLRELERVMSSAQLDLYKKEFELLWKVVNQQRSDRDKIYSIHKPFTACIAKGKAHKKYEFGNKIGLMINPGNLVIQAITAFRGNPHDSRTIAPLLRQAEQNFNYLPQEVVYDRGGKGKKQINGVQISTPSKPLKSDNTYQRRKKRKKFRRRAAIEPVIGHLKEHFRMAQNYLHGNQSARMNALLAAAGWNLKKKMEKLSQAFLLPIYFIQQMLLTKFESRFNHKTSNLYLSW